ncbi:MAG: hypothetical protein H7Y88_04900 [Phycisphaerales bacterium]|nr:hypothetical protein [Phycisphaerales bacterium]
MRRFESRNVDQRMMESLEARIAFAADPVTADHPVWFIPRGEAAIDGVLEGAWESAYTIRRTQATRDNSAVTIRYMYNDAGLLMSAEVQDQFLWSDGAPGTQGHNRWDLEQDDSITFYIDGDGSRDEWFGAGDRAFGVNIANSNVPTEGASIVRRYKFVQGNGSGGAPDVNPGGVLPDGVAYWTVVDGTVNNNADLDNGWVTEMFIPWAALNMSAPTHGSVIGLNFDMIQDNTGGARDLSDHRDAPDRFTVPHHPDDHVQGVHSSYSSTQAGIHGPVNYAIAMFIDSRAGAKPATITGVTSAESSAFGARLNFLAPAGTTAGAGHAAAYEIRYSASAITTEALWLAATEMPNSYVPRLAGQPESLRVAGLAPATTYHFVVRAVDAAGNLGDRSASSLLTTTVQNGPTDLGRVIPAPNGSGMIHENGSPFVAVGDHLGLSWGFTRQLFPGDVWDMAQFQYHNFHDEPALEGPYAPYFDMLASKGINTMRVYLELQHVHRIGNPNPPRGMYWLEEDRGEFNDDMRHFVLNVLEEAGSRGIHVIFSPFDSFSYDEAFGSEGPWATNFGGPLSDINNFFQDQVTLDIAKNRMTTVIDWARSSPYFNRVLGWEPVSEWDSFEWTLNAEGNADPGRETEMRRRALWIDSLAAHIKAEDPAHLVFNSTIVRDPRGPLARETFYSRTWDALTPHLYTNSNEEGINNPQTDRKIMPAVENAMFTQYWLSHRVDNRPIINGEWGMTRVDWPGGLPQYSAAFTQQEDEAIYRTVLWSGLATGQFGTGFRIAADELGQLGGVENYFVLTQAMRDLQHVVSRFFASTSLALDWANFNPETLAGRVSASATGKSLLAWGVADGLQGLVYVLQNGNVSSGTVSGGRLTIEGLTPNRLVDAEVWSTAPGTTAPLSVLTGVFNANGDLVLDLPNFGEDVVVKFKARPVSSQTQKLVSIGAAGFAITFGLGVDQQPFAYLVNSDTGVATIQDIAALSNFYGRVVDMTPYATADGMVHLAITDADSNLWLISGNPGAGTWSSQNLTASIHAPGLTGDLTTYQPSWGAQHIAGLDARGHAVNYWFVPGATTQWQFTNLTEAYGGVPMSGGLTGYVTGWDGLNLAGVNAAGELIVYWWTPTVADVFGVDKWLIQNMKSDFDGPALSGQLDAYVTSWGGLNVAGTDESGDIWTYWWAPGLDPEPNRWRVTNITEAGNGPQISQGTEVAFSTDGGINIFGLDNSSELNMLRWLPGGDWANTNVTDAATGPLVQFPLSSAAIGDRMIVGGRTAGRTLVVFSYILSTGAWSDVDTGITLAG